MARGLVAVVVTLSKSYDLEYIFRKPIALPGDAGRACRPRGIGLGGRLRVLRPEASGKH